MLKIDPRAAAVNAAGIADALRTMQLADHDGANRMEDITRAHEGWVGVMLQVAEAGEIMERFRVTRGAKSTWGGELPYFYDVWDAIAQALWDQLGSMPLDALVRQAIEQAIGVQVA